MRALVLRVAILVISSKIVKGIESDTGRDNITELLKDHDLELCAYQVVPDEREVIQDHLRDLCDIPNMHVVLTIGGTGVRPTDWAPEATRDVIDKEIPGIGEAMRSESIKTVRTAMLSRGTAGIRSETLIVNLPGSIRGVRDNLSVLLPILDHTISKISRGTNTPV